MTISKATFATTDQYEETSQTYDFTIAKADGQADVDITGWIFGETANAPTSTSSTNTSAPVTYYYKLASDDDTQYTTDVPTSAGDYVVKAVYGTTTNYNEVSATKTFTIAKAVAQASVTLENWTYGETASTPVPTSSTNGTKNVTYEYKLKGAEDSTYSSKVPTDAGDYVLKATFGATGNYQEVVVTKEFTIEKAVKPDNTPATDAIVTPTAITSTVDLALPSGWSLENKNMELVPGGYTKATIVYTDEHNYQHYTTEVLIAGAVEIIPSATTDTFTIGVDTNATIKCNGVLDEFKAVYMDGNLVDPSHYTLIRGSTIIVFNKAYMDSLAIGEHQVNLVYTASSVSTTLTVYQKKTNGQVTPTSKKKIKTRSTKVKTEDDTETWYYTWMMIVSGLYATYLMIRNKREYDL